MSESNDEKNDQIPITELKKIWAPFGMFIGAVISVYEIYQLWLGDQAVVTWIGGVLGSGILLFFLSYISFNQVEKRRTVFPQTTYNEFRFPKYYKIARLSLILCAILFIFGGISVYYHNKWLDKQFIILVGDFTGPNSDSYRVNEIILSKLRTGLSNETGIIIRPLGKVITEQDGSEKAREFGMRYKADLVIWGWYGVTESDTLITVHFENLTGKASIPQAENDTFTYKGNVNVLDSFEIQQQLSKELTGLVLVIKGIIEEQSGDYQGYEDAKNLFERAINTWDEYLVGNEYLYYQRGYAYFQLGDCKNAIIDYSKFLSVRPNGRDSDEVFQFRGLCNYGQGNYKLAINDYTEAIKLSPKSDTYFLMRAKCYYEIGDYKSSLADLDKWQEYAINHEKGDKPLDLKTENTSDKFQAEVLRGDNYEAIGEYAEAIKHYSVIDNGYSGILNIEPLEGRANAYNHLKNYEKAFGDYSSVIKLYNEYEQKDGYEIFQRELKVNALEAYLNRAKIYFMHGKIDLAINDINSDIEIDNSWEIPYLLRAYFHFADNDFPKTVQDLNKVLENSDDSNLHQSINEIITLITNKSSFSDNEKDDILQKIMDINNSIIQQSWIQLLEDIGNK